MMASPPSCFRLILSTLDMASFRASACATASTLAGPSGTTLDGPSIKAATRTQELRSAQWPDRSSGTYVANTSTRPDAEHSVRPNKILSTHWTRTLAQHQRTQPTQ